MTLGRYITDCARDKGLGDVLGTTYAQVPLKEQDGGRWGIRIRAPT